MPSFAELLAGKGDESLKKIQEENKKKSPPQNSNSDFFKIKMPDFVAVDLETTGLDRKSDRVTEIGMVKYIGGVEVDSYSTLINPGKPIPKEIVRLTGITDEAVTNAPKFEEVTGEVLEFIGRLAICGHQVSFDFNFLNIEFAKAGLPKIKNWQIDTLTTARTLLPAEEGYALGKVANKLGIKLENAHRALDDARASGEIALKLLPKIGELPPHTRKTLAEIAPFSLTKKIFESSVRHIKTDKPKAQPTITQKPIQPIDSEFLLTDSTIDELFSEDGKLSELVSSYTKRDEQVSFAKDVATTLNQSTLTAIEAGTGTGKSLAYLLPVAKWAFERGERVIVSTNTKNLQEQLASSELQTIKKVISKDLTFTVLKGKNNYLCLKGWESFISGETASLSARERGSVMPLITWADSTKTGDIEEQNSFNRNYFSQIWATISAEGKNCSGCSHFNNCFMQNAKRKARASHIVVVNHALFYSDIIRGSDFIGDAGAIVIDEAHQLEKRGHQMLQVDLDSNKFKAYIDFIQQAVTTTVNATKNENDEKFKDSMKELKKVLKKLRKQSESFMSELSNWLINNQNNSTDRNGNMLTIPIEDRPFRGSSPLAGLRLAFDDIVDAINLVRQSGRSFLEDTISDEELKQSSDSTTQMRADVNYLADANTEGDIFWLEGPKDQRWIKLVGTTLAVGDFLESFWKEFGRPVICTSATLSPKKELKYFAKRAGLTNLDTVLKQYKTPFDSSRVKFIGTTFSPEPTDINYHIFVADRLEELRDKTGRNILVLFTNNSFLNKVYEELISREEGKKHRVFAQGISGNRAWIQKQMSEVKSAILLGSGSFWEGVDIPGEACEIVVIPKLPFPVPTHPLSKALADEAEKTGRNGFVDYFMPEALLAFRQGAGRLIRHTDDRGILLVLDNRMVNKGYGKQFIKTVESELVKPSNSNELLLEVESFFSEDNK
jgi:ATP-dependent DNA helicase DinG